MPDNPPILPMRRLVADINGAEIQSPSSGRHHAVAVNGSIYAAGTYGDNVIEVWVLVRRTMDPSTSDDPATDGFVQATLNAGTKTWTVAEVPGTITAMRTGNPNNKLVCVVKLNDNTFARGDVIYFRGRPHTETIQVLATACIWFTFAPNDMDTGPDPQDDTEPSVGGHRPERLVVPANCGTFTFTASGAWRRFSTDPDTGPDGTTDLVKLERPGYRSTTYLSEVITDIMCETNKLIGMFIDAFETPVGEPFPMGAGESTPVIPTLAYGLVLAFHDGKRWHNNSGTVDVTIDWNLLGAGFFRVRGLPLLP